MYVAILEQSRESDLMKTEYDSVLTVAAVNPPALSVCVAAGKG